MGSCWGLLGVRIGLLRVCLGFGLGFLGLLRLVCLGVAWVLLPVCLGFVRGCLGLLGVGFDVCLDIGLVSV